MNVYDFDKTIYDGDSTIDFYFFCLKKYPHIIRLIPKQLWGAVSYKIGKICKTEFKEVFYCFFDDIDDIDSLVIEFWNAHESKIKKWYVDNHKNNDLIISASPQFLLQEICNRIEVSNLIASQVNNKTGKYTGENCYGEEKVRRFKEEYNEVVECFYSDSMSDGAMAQLAQNAYLVHGDNIKSWPCLYIN